MHIATIGKGATLNRRTFLQGIGASIGALVTWAPRAAKADESDIAPAPETMGTFTAWEHSDLVASIYLDGQDVTDVCCDFFGSSDPGIEVEGWVVLYNRRGDGTFPAGPNGEAIAYLLRGSVRWRGFTAGNRSHLIIDNPGIHISAGVLQSE